MIEKIIEVPDGIDYISDWGNFKNLIPHGKILLNKKYPGCGMTTYYLQNPDPIILCAPRKLLLKNKQEQMNSGLCYHYDLPEKTKRPKEGELTPVQKNYNELCDYLNKCYINCTVPKILVTYDSLYHVLQVTNSFGFQFKIVIDEAHVIFSDTEMKPERTESLCQLLNEYPAEIVYISATPDKDDFEKVSYFQNLIYIELKWPSSKIQENIIHYIPIRSTLKAAVDIINDYKSKGYFQAKGNRTSTEAVFFLNDVTKICRIISACELTPDEVNIICSQMSADKIREKLGSSYSIGKPPKRGHQHKTYTFCSKTAFMGCDFYSTNACSYIFADANLKNMTTDIALDLPQILGRQRLASNVFKDEATVFVNLNTGKLETQEEFDKMREFKLDMSNNLENQLKTWTTDLLNTIEVKQRESYVVIKENYITGVKEAIVSEMRQIAENRAWRLRHKVYKDHETVRTLITESDIEVMDNGLMTPEVREFYLWFVEQGDSQMKLRGYTEFLEMYPLMHDQILHLCTLIPQEYHDVYSILGPDKIKGYGYQMSRLKKLLNTEDPSENMIKNSLVSIFSVGDRLSNKEVKTRIQKVYDSLELKKKAKASDLENYFECQRTNVVVGGKPAHGIKILSIK